MQLAEARTGSRDNDGNEAELENPFDWEASQERPPETPAGPETKVSGARKERSKSSPLSTLSEYLHDEWNHPDGREDKELRVIPCLKHRVCARCHRIAKRGEIRPFPLTEKTPKLETELSFLNSLSTELESESIL